VPSATEYSKGAVLLCFVTQSITVVARCVAVLD